MTVVAYTDGSAYQGAGGVGVVILGIEPGPVRIAGYLPPPGITNQVAELTAAVVAFDFLRNMAEVPVSVTVVSDSAYLINCFVERWYDRWMRKAWVKNGREVANRPLWETLIAQSALFEVGWIHMRGHGRGPHDTPRMRHWNGITDNLAHTARVERRSWVKEAT